MKIGKRRFAIEKNVAKVTHRAVTITLSAAVVGVLLAPAASACGTTPQQAPFVMQQLLPDARNPLALATFADLARDLRSVSSTASAPIVGMWSFQLISQGNTARTPSIADGTQLNFGYIQLHSDETEIQNAGARSPAQQNFCLGVWQKTGDVHLPGQPFCPELRRHNGNVARQNHPRREGYRISRRHGHQWHVC